MENCGSNVDGALLWAGNDCTTTVVSSPCVTTNGLTLTCPAGNTLENRAPVADTWHPRVLCKVCAIDAIETDTHLGHGFYTGTLRFGANQKNGMLDESDVKEYKVYFSDMDLNKLDDAVATVSVQGSKIETAFCGCSKSRSSVTLAGVAIPAGATGFMVVPVDNNDYEMPVGAYVGGLEDLWTTTTTTTSATTTSKTTTPTTTITTTTVTLKPIVAGAPRAALAGAAAALLLAVGLAA